MKRIVVLGLISFMGLILSGCSMQPLPPQIVKVKQKSQIETPPYPIILNPREWCDRNESDCIVGIATYNFVVMAEFVAKYDVNVKAHQ